MAQPPAAASASGAGVAAVGGGGGGCGCGGGAARPGGAGRLEIYAAQVLVAHCLSAILAEMVFSSEGFNFPGVYGAAEFGVFALAPLALRAAAQGPLAVVRLLQLPGDEVALFAACGLAMALSHGAGLAANVRINYSTAVIFGSARLPAVLLARPAAGLGRGCAPAAAHAAAACVMLGLLLFGLAERRGSPRFSAAGLAFVATNLVLGALTFNLQDRVLKGPIIARRRRRGCDAVAVSAAAARGGSQHVLPLWKDRDGADGGGAGVGAGVGGGGAGEGPDRRDRLMVVQYATGACLCLAYAAASGEAADFAGWSRERGSGPLGALLPVFCGAVLTAVGVRALMGVTAEFDAARASTITSLRKVCTFLLSFLLFPKPCGILHVLGAALTLCGSAGVHRVLSRPQAARRPGRSSEVVAVPVSPPGDGRA